MSPAPTLDNTLGAALIGVIVSAVLYGVTFVQTFYYFSHYQKDPWHVKLIVTLCLISDSIHLILISHTIYSYVITGWGNPAAIGTIVWSIIVEVIFNALTALLVQSFLALRIWKLSNKNVLATGVVMLLVLIEFGCVMAYVGKAFPMKTYIELAEIKPLSMAVNAFAAAGDVVIAAILCFLLQQSRTGFQKSDSIINRLILFTINTGLLTSMCAVASLISITAAGNTFIYISFYFCLGRFYCNTLLATLNARKSMREESSRGPEVSLSLQSKSPVPPPALVRAGRATHNSISIKIDTKQEYARDDEDSLEQDDVKHGELKMPV